MQARDAWDRAADCAARADKTTDERMRILFTKLRNSWIRVANDRELAALAGAGHEAPQGVGMPASEPSSAG